MGLKDGFELVGDVSLRANSGEIIKELNLVEKALESVANVAKGTGLEKYWKSLEDEAQRQKRLLEEVRLSYERFNSINSEETAAGLIKAVNALQAVGVTDLSPVINDLEKFRSVFSDAMQLTPNAESFSADNFRTLFDALDTLQNKGYDVRDILSRLSSSGDTEFLRKEVERLTEELNNAKNKTTVLNEELRKAKSSAGIDELESQIERLNDELGETEESLARVYNRAEREFDTFLKGHGIQPDEDEFSSYYENIRDGSETAMQAISRFRVEYQHLFDTNSRDVGAMAVIDSLNAKIETLTSDISYLTNAIKDMIDNGVKTAAGQASSSTQEMAGAFDALREAAQSLSGGGGGSGGGPNGPIDDIIEKLIRLASIDLSNLENTRAILLNIAKMGGASISASTVKNLGALLESVKQFGAGGASIVIPDFTKLNELAIDKDQLKALASYLPKIADPNLEKLTVLNDVNFDKLNEISADKSVSSLARLIKELNGADLSKINELLDGINLEKFQNTKIDDSFARLASALSRLQRLNTEDLKGITDLNWQNLNSIDIKPTAAANIESLAASLTKLSAAREELRQIVEFVREYQATSAMSGGGAPEISADLEDVSGKLVKIRSNYQIAEDGAKELTGRMYTYKEVTEDAVRTTNELWLPSEDDPLSLEKKTEQIVTNKEAAAKAHEREAEANRKEQIAVNNLQRELTAYANTLTKTIDLAKQHGLGTAAETDALIKNRDSVISLRNSLDSLGTSGLKDVQTQFSGVRKEAESSRIAIENSVNSTKAQNQAALEYFRNIRQAESLKQQILKDISHSSKASAGFTAEDRKKLEQYAVQVDALSKKYEKGFLTSAQFSKELANLRNQATGASNNIRQAGEMTLSFGERIKKAASNLAYYFSISRVIMQVIRYMRDLVQQSIELDKQMGQLRIVTNETEEAYAGYADTIAKTAKEIGSSMTDLISATTTFARLGYSLDDSSILAKYTGMLQQVGDIDASSAQDAITAITKAFPDDASIDNIESVMDRLVVAGRIIARVCSNAYLVIGYNGQSRFGIIA